MLSRFRNQFLWFFLFRKEPKKPRGAFSSLISHFANYLNLPKKISLHYFITLFSPCQYAFLRFLILISQLFLTFLTFFLLFAVGSRLSAVLISPFPPFQTTKPDKTKKERIFAPFLSSSHTCLFRFDKFRQFSHQINRQRNFDQLKRKIRHYAKSQRRPKSNRTAVLSRRRNKPNRTDGVANEKP